MSSQAVSLTSPPLTVPIKKSEPFDWKAHGKYVLTEAGLDAGKFQAEIIEFEHMRNRCLGCGTDRVGASLYVSYYQQLAAVTSRFVQVDVPEGCPGFTWNDAYDAELRMGQQSVAFEKANILFNLAAIFSQIAATLPSATPEDLNAVFMAFQSSASVLHYIKEHFLHPPLHDISKPSLEFLWQLMMAQSQEAAARKATLIQALKGTPPKLVGRLWQGTLVLYAGALKAWYAPAATKIRENVQETVPRLIDQKLKLATVHSLHWTAQANYADEQHGEAVARLNRAIKMSEDVLSSDEAVLTTQFQSMKDDVLTPLRDKIAKENSLIFHQPQPSLLTEPEPAILATVLGIHDVFKAVLGESNQPRDLFAAAVPLRIQQDAAKYHEEVEKLVTYEAHLVDELYKEWEFAKKQAGSTWATAEEFLAGQGKSRLQEKATIAIQQGLSSDMKTRGESLSAMMRSELELNIERLKSLSRGLFDNDHIRRDDRRTLVERIDILSAVYESFMEDLEAVPRIAESISTDLAAMEKRVVEYSQGQYGIDISKFQSDSSVSIARSQQQPILPEDLIETPKKLLKQLQDKVRKDDITEALVRSKLNISEIIKESLSQYDPFAGELEESISKAKEALKKYAEECRRVTSERLASPEFQGAVSEIEKRETLLKLYSRESEGIRNSFNRLIKLKADIDEYRSEFTNLVKSVESAGQNYANGTLPPGDTSRERALEGRDVLLRRLSELGLNSQNT